MNWDTDLIEDIVGSIKANRIVPLIGPGAFYIEGYMSVQEYIVRKSLETIKKADPESELSESDRLEYCFGYKGMTNLDKLFTIAHRTLNKTIKKILTSPDFSNKLKLNPKVEEFLRRGDFPLILTTCVFRNIERILPKYEKKGIPYQLGQSKEESIPDDVVSNPCVYYLFGYIDNYNEEAVITEKDYLKYLYFIQDTNSGPTKLKEYLSEKYLLSLGCDMPDWTFRFLIYSLKEQNGDLVYQDRKEDSFVGGVSIPHIDKNLDDFLASIGYYSEEDSDGVLELLNGRMKELPQKKKPMVFLSMCNEDYDDIGKKIKERISDVFDVWTYPDHEDFQYWEIIESGLAECKYFVPIVSDTAFIRLTQISNIERDIAKAKDDSKSRGFITEWQLALDYQRKYKKGQVYCIPYHFGKRFLWKEFNDELREKDSDFDLLYPLFFPGKGAQKFDVSLEELTGQKLKEHIELTGKKLKEHIKDNS